MLLSAVLNLTNAVDVLVERVNKKVDVDVERDVT
jgi:hypothetical protein